MTALHELKEMAQRFVDGEDRSMNLVNRMEDILVEHFLDSDLFESLGEGLAMYRPGAGHPYWSEPEIVQLFSEKLLGDR
ncbi:hypothetical protein [Streptomyces enissocaesilis]|uniref:CdiI immunity protein domain-containing protein n=1 Tax=Streptomyces enissocaesilis TaxID=332589 RepID=A0ABP6JGL5_9ACTN